MNKKIPILDNKSANFEIDNVLGYLSVNEKLDENLAYLAYELNMGFLLNPILMKNDISGNYNIVAFNFSNKPLQKSTEQKLSQTLCRNCSQPHKLLEEDAGSEREILRLCEKCFKTSNTDNVAFPVQGDINQIAQRVHNLAVSKGWHDENETEDSFIERTCNNMHDEVSELHEAWRNNKLHDLCDKADEMEKNNIKPLTYIEEELADIIIRAMDSAVKLGVDIGDAINRKHLYNSSRKQRHGGKRS